MDKAAESHRILLDAWGALSHNNPYLQTLREGPIETIHSGLPVMFFNLSVTTQTPESMADFEVDAADTMAWNHERNQPWMFVLSKETLADLYEPAQAWLSQQGFVPLLPLYGMEADQLTPARQPAPRCDWWTEIHASLPNEIISINEAAYGMPIAQPDSLYMQQWGWWSAPDRLASILIADSTPCSAAAVLNSSGTRYVALVATRPEAQRKGYAETAMRHVLDRALAAGQPQRMYLHASAVGRPVYERMGFTQTSEYLLLAQMH